MLELLALLLVGAVVVAALSAVLWVLGVAFKIAIIPFKLVAGLAAGVGGLVAGAVALILVVPLAVVALPLLAVGVVVGLCCLLVAALCGCCHVFV